MAPTLSTLKDKYESFLLSNLGTISTIESSLRNLTWFLPGRFEDGELVGEAIYAALNLTSLYHDLLLARLSAPSPHARYCAAWGKLYAAAARALVVLGQIELLVEMVARRREKKGKCDRWRWVVGIEAVKAFLRLILLHQTSFRPLLSPPIPSRDVDPSLEHPPSPAQPPRSSSSTTDPTPKTSLEDLKSAPSLESYLLSHTLHPHNLTPAPSLLRPLKSTSHRLSEIIYAFQPLIYVLALRHLHTSPRPRLSRWTPLLLSLLLSLLARQLRRPAQGALERSEYAGRERQLGWYLFRGPVWEDFTRQKLKGFADRTEHWPLVGLLSGVVKDYLPLVDDYYYYTSS